MSRYYTGNVTFTSVLAQPSQWGTSTVSLTAIFIALFMAVLSAVVLPSSNDKIHQLEGFHLVTAWSFLSKQYDFFRGHFKKTGRDMFRFRFLQHRVIAMAGEKNRKIFFNDRNLDIAQGNLILRGGIPRLDDISIMDASGESTTTGFVKRLTTLFRKERINQVLPHLLEDVNRRMNSWGPEGKLDPFREVYDLVFQMTVRMATCKELSEDSETINRLSKLYWDLEKSATPASILFPWFPSPAKKMKQQATMALYTALLSYVNVRRNASTPSADPIDFFISEGTSDDVIVGTIMSIIFAGTINTGVNSCRAMFHLGIHPTWKRKAINEYEALVEKYTGTNTTSSDPLHTRLSTIPLDAWEDELPVLDLIIRETLRISGSATSYRRNIGKDIQAGEATIKRGDFLVYARADVNLNPDIYTNPMMFDPDRYGPGREEDRKETFGYLAWGAGRHLCAGMKIAKLEIKVVLAMMLLKYEYELVDGNGNYLKAAPDQDRNDLSRPIGGSCYLKYKRVIE